MQGIELETSHILALGYTNGATPLAQQLYINKRETGKQEGKEL